MSEGSQDRMRESPRVRAKARLNLFDPTVGWTWFETRDVSMSGAFVPSQVLLDEGTSVSLVAELPSGGRVPVDAVVVRTTAGADGTGAGMGLRWVSLCGYDAARWIQELRAQRWGSV